MEFSFENMQKWYIDNQLTLSVAESCTGGMISAMITSQPGASKYYAGGLVTYQTEQKEQWLEISAASIEAAGVVSEEIAAAMADSCRERFKTHWSLSTTGFLGPDQPQDGPEVGTVCIGLSGPEETLFFKKVFDRCARWEMQQEIALFALRFLWENREAQS